MKCGKLERTVQKTTKLHPLGFFQAENRKSLL